MSDEKQEHDRRMVEVARRIIDRHGSVGSTDTADLCHLAARVIDGAHERDALRADLEQSKARHKMCQESLASVCAERDSLSSALTTAQRDRADALVDAIETTAEKIAAFLDDDRMSNHDDHTPSWIALTNAVRWIRDGLWRGQAHKSASEQIAQWLDAKAAKLEATLASIPDNESNREQRDEFGWGASYTSGAAADIRRGAWRPSPATDKEE